MTRRPRHKLIADLINVVRRNSASTVFFHASVADRMQLGPSDHKCLDMLFRGGPMSPGELATRSNLTTGAITGVVDRLEKAGYVRRVADPIDRRRLLVELLTAKATADFKPVFEGLRRSMYELLDQYTVEQLELLQVFLEKSSDVLDREAARLRAADAQSQPRRRK
ncbi:MAG: MarR family transcriptional regulator [Steroidobacteraceae bacterium]